MKRYKEKANWLPDPIIFIKQIIVSIFSYITLFKFKGQKDGIKQFFYSNYYIKSDGLVFDGTSSGYFSRIKKIFNISEFSKSTTIDLGCGQGAFYNWMCDNGIRSKAYIGIDFAIKPCKKSNFCTFICDDIRNINKYLRDEPYIIVLCNVLCYLEDNTIKEVFDALKPNNRIIIIEPAPNIFWDAHFNGIKPKYRTYNEVCLLLKEYNCTVENSIRDYFFKVSKFYFSEMSYGIIAVKN